MVDWNKVDAKLNEILVIDEFVKLADKEERDFFLEQVKGVMQNFDLWANLLMSIGEDRDKPANERSLIGLLALLFLTEGFFGFTINWIIYLLMLRSHHDIWSEKRQKFVTTFDELLEVPLYVKLRFLEQHNCKDISEICPRDLRNAIAHMNYRICPDGVVAIIKRGKVVKKYQKREIVDKCEDILTIFEKIRKLTRSQVELVSRTE